MRRSLRFTEPQQEWRSGVWNRSANNKSIVVCLLRSGQHRLTVWYSWTPQQPSTVGCSLPVSLYWKHEVCNGGGYTLVASHPNTFFNMSVNTPHWWAPIGAKQLSACASSICCLGRLGSDHWFPVNRMDRVTVPQTAQHCSSAAVWFRVRIPVISSANCILLRLSMSCIRMCLRWQKKFIFCAEKVYFCTILKWLSVLPTSNLHR